MIHTVALSLGSNCGDRERAIREAVKWLTGVLEETRACGSYETEAIGGGTRPYLNSVVEARTGLSDGHLNALLKEYERAHGRDEAARTRGDVPIDIDLVVSDGRILRPRDYTADFFQIGFRNNSRGR